MTQASYLIYDYETFGTDPRRDWPVQFACVRLDSDWQPVDAPRSFYCRLPEDVLPDPEACLIHKITPQHVSTVGLPEPEFAARVYAELARPQTCTLGYNTLRFDDEFTRQLCYRNFFPIYDREWRNGNTRWDLIDLVRTAYALRPEGFVWPTGPEGLPVFKLEVLAPANGVLHEQAHDARSDVLATAALARKLRAAQPRLFAYLLGLREKTAVARLLRVDMPVPLLHVSGQYPAAEHCLGIVLPLAVHPTNPNEIIIFNLRKDPAALLDCDIDAIRQRVFVKNHALATVDSRIALRTVRMNRCPALAPLSVLRESDVARLGIDLPLIQARARQLTAAQGLGSKLAAVFCSRPLVPEDDPELALYQGFFAASDQTRIAWVRDADASLLSNPPFVFDDLRLSEMYLRYRARNFPQTLTVQERQHWQQYCHNKWWSGAFGKPPISDYLDRLAELRARAGRDVEQVAVLDALRVYADKLYSENHATEKEDTCVPS